MTQVVHTTPEQLSAELAQLEAKMFAAIVAALRKTARESVALAQQSQKNSDPRFRGSGRMHSAWAARDTPDGAEMGNSAPQSWYAEKGRRAGKKPPIGPILEWAMNSGIPVSRLNLSSKKKVKTGRGGKRHTDQFSSIEDPRHRVRMRRQARAALNRQKLYESFAWAVQKKIGKRGTKGRWVLKRTLPKIRALLKANVKAEIAKVFRAL